ncbi:MAG: DUF3108 domain-containing protein [Duncaniella sp.]|nr:DUF3108 domain-containing protein [Duncaniella sp.]
MKRILMLPLAALMAVIGGTGALRAQEHLVSLADETLTYDVIYKWGFINKVAGYATMSLRNNGPYYRASVFAENAPWANSIYMLRDTLYTTMTKENLYPISYTYIAHENGKYKKDVLDFQHSGNTFTATAVRYKQPKPGAPMTSSTIELEGQGMTVDMLSSFFYLRTLDFDAMGPGASKTVNIFSGSKKELLRITYVGKQNITVNGNNYETYYINFTFTRKGVESSAPIEGWITTDARRIPLRVEGQLPVGKVKALYTGLNP